MSQLTPIKKHLIKGYFFLFMVKFDHVYNNDKDSIMRSTHKQTHKQLTYKHTPSTAYNYVSGK